MTTLFETTPLDEIVLRPYQREAVHAAVEKMRAHGSTLIVQATGTGKTVEFVAIVKECLSRGQVMIVVNTEELVGQTHKTIKNRLGITPQVEKAEYQAERDAEVVIASVQTLNSKDKWDRYRYEKFDPASFGLVIFDEADLSITKTWRRVARWFEKNDDCWLLGVTATPDRLDGAAMGVNFASVAYTYTLPDAINDGYLVPLRMRRVMGLEVDWSNIATVAGDFKKNDLADEMELEENLQAVVQPTVEAACGMERGQLARLLDEADALNCHVSALIEPEYIKKTLVFAVRRHHAERMCEIINRFLPGQARYLDGSQRFKKSRKQIIREYAIGEFRFLCQVGIAGRGFDDPGIEMLSIARPTKSRALLTQFVGRAARPIDDIVPELNTQSCAEERKRVIAGSSKPHAAIMDFANASAHNLVNVGDILAGRMDDPLRAKVEEIISNEEEIDVQDAVNIAQEALEEEEREEAERQAKEQADRQRMLEEQASEKRKKILARVNYRTEEADAFDLVGLTPQKPNGWRAPPLSPKQLAWLRREFGDQITEADTTHQRQLFKKVVERANKGLCTVKQVRFLKKNGVDARHMSKSDASHHIDRIIKSKGH